MRFGQCERCKSDEQGVNPPITFIECVTFALCNPCLSEVRRQVNEMPLVQEWTVLGERRAALMARSQSGWDFTQEIEECCRRRLQIEREAWPLIRALVPVEEA